MPEHPLRRILSRLVNRPDDAANTEIEYIHRGAPDDKISIMGSNIRSVAKGSFTLDDGETQIPFHRILMIRDRRSGSLFWEKRRPAKASDQDHEH